MSASPALRWGGSLVAVVLVHLGFAAWLLSRPSLVVLPPPDAPAIMIDLAPEPAVPDPAPEPAAEPAPPPPEVKPKPPPPEPVKQEEPPPEPEPSPMPKMEAPAVADPPAPLPPPPPPKPKLKPKPKPRPVPEPAREEPAPTPPMPAPAQIAAPRLSPSPAPTAQASGAAATSWQAQLVARLNRFKRYPAEAQAQRDEGVAYLRFRMDRAGRVLNYRLERSSGHELLDREALALIERAQPLPEPPPDVGGQTIELVVPLRFHLSR